MENLLRIIAAVLILFFSGCRNVEDPVPETKTAAIKLSATGFGGQMFAVDADNLASEQVINNIAVFLTEPASDVITHKFINAGFSGEIDYKLVSLSLEPAELGVRDIYVVTNYGDVDLGAVTTVTGLRELNTPLVNKTNNLVAGMGFCMYGTLAGFDFGNDAGDPAEVPVVRTCAKYRVSLTFPQSPELSLDNSFLITEAATYTRIVPGSQTVLPLDEYFNFASAVPLLDGGGNSYVNTVYVYEAAHAPELYLYTHFTDTGGQEQQFIGTLPSPVRNYLYDIELWVFEEETRAGTETFGTGKSRREYRMKVTAYDSAGHLAEEYFI